MRVLVTGISGFAGSHLAEALLAKGNVELFGTSRSARENLALREKIAVGTCDLTDSAACERLVREVRPEQIYHLAGYAHAGQSLHEHMQAWTGNLDATLNLYEAVLQWGGKLRILFVGSGLIYGDPEQPDTAQNESAVLKPVSPYASSKAAADLASYQYTRSAQLDIVRARPFNHIGPRQSTRYAIAHFAQQIAAIEQSHQEPVLATGNLSAQRDFTDVRDMVAAYILLMERGRTGEAYNIGTGTTHSMQSVLDLLLHSATCPIRIQQKDALLRSSESTIVRADASKVRGETGWRPRFSLEQTLSDTLEYWRSTLAANEKG
jgi:GDP-4-dehydro-6-deoxy-D-mannose reductase